MTYLVTKDLLDLYDRYDGDLGLLDERWAPQEDREFFRKEQFETLGAYLENLRLITSNGLSEEFRGRIQGRIRDLEPLIAPEVVATLRERLR